MARMRRNSEQSLEYKIEQAEAKAAKTRAAHEKAIDELKKLYDMQRERQKEEILKAMEGSTRSFEEILEFINTPSVNGVEDE